MFYYVLLFKAKQRFAYLLLIQSVYLFLNVLFLFWSVFHFFKCFRFVSLSKQFDIEALLSKNLYYGWHPYTRQVCFKKSDQIQVFVCLFKLFWIFVCLFQVFLSFLSDYFRYFWVFCLFISGIFEFFVCLFQVFLNFLSDYFRYFWVFCLFI